MHCCNPRMASIVSLVLAQMTLVSSSFADDVIKAPVVDVVAEKLRPLPSATNMELGQESLSRLRANTSDTASLLESLPGVSLAGAGGVSSLPAIHGMSDDRVRIKVDGMHLISACANHMNPPLSYIDPSNVSVVKAFAGITPVSVGGDSVSGTIQVDSAAPEFALPGQGMLVNGRAAAFYRSNNDARGANVTATVAGESLSVRYTGSTVDADNYTAARKFKPAGQAAWGRGWLDGDEVGSSAYEAQNHALAFGLRHENHLLELKLGWQNIPEQGFPNQRMDMTDNDSRQINLRYTGQFDWGQVQASAYHERTRHSMQFGDDKLYWYQDMMMNRNVAGMPMDTEGRNTGAQIKADVILSERDVLRVGGEYQRYRLDDWWNPVAHSGMMMGPGRFWNINNGQRDRYDVFAEWEAHWSPQWVTQLGARSGTVKMDAGNVQGYSNTMMMGMMGAGYKPAADAFNARQHDQDDHNWDVTALARFTPNSGVTLEAGYAMKTRSPNLYERYTWSMTNSMVMNMNNWVGDGNGYVGNLRLDPEIAHTLSVSADWHDAAQSDWNLKVTPFYTHVEDYIDAVACSRIYNNCPMSRKDGFVNLSLDNQTANLYGVDVSGKAQLVEGTGIGSFAVSGLLNYVRGRNTDSHDDLYNMMPLNATLALEHHLGGWSNTLQAKLVSSKDHVQSVRKELETSGYALLNFYSSYQWKQVRFDLGVENLLDKDYDNPLGGAYLGQGATMGTSVAWGTAVPGMGRSINVGLTVNF